MLPNQRRCAETAELSVTAARVVAALLCSAALGCTGAVSNSTHGSGGGAAASMTPSGAGGMTAGAGGAGSPMQPPTDCKQPQAGRAPLRRLIRFEYNNTVDELFKITTRPADALP